LAITADLMEEDETEKTVRKTVDFFGGIDILVNNVGGVSAETMMQVRDNMAASGDQSLPDVMHHNSKARDQQYRLNLKTHVILSQAVRPISPNSAVVRS
jgi:NAD(P)-dependent dehydrogenase (short-subunit alcohol dehydrogenase family)